MNTMNLLRIAVLPSLIMAWLPWQPSSAGVTGENVILVVNADSHDSRTVANHYAELRQIPAVNLIFLKDIPAGLYTSLDQYRQKILLPVLTTINERKLAGQTKVIAYSVGFPTSVRIDEHTKKLVQEDQKKYQLPVGAINGLTYLYRFVIADDQNYLNWSPNLYARGQFERHFVNPFAGEKAEEFKRADTAFQEENFEQAASGFSQLAKLHPTLSPLAIRAAESYAKLGDDASAMKWIVTAIRSGWNSAGYLNDSETLGPLAKKPALKAAVDRLSDAPTVLQGPVGFAGDRSWTPSGHSISNQEGGVPYLMSCMLGVVHPRGSTTDQVIEYLKKSASADRTYPDGKFGFAKTKDVRSKTRMPGLPAALGRLLSQGKTPDIFSTALPANPERYAGLMLGTATMNLASSRFEILPGAIAESLTSAGAAFGAASQTKCTELLHYGAAISSGAVTEPYSLQFKFPFPAIQAYYAEGATAIEAFYLTVMSPYQLLIVGDPVCQPFAKAPDEEVTIETKRGETTEVVIKRTVSSVAQDPVRSGRVEVFAEGKLARIAPSTDEITMRLPGDASGAIEFRVTLVAQGPLETRKTFPLTVDLKGPKETPKIQAIESNENDVVKVKLSCSGADSIELRLFDQVLGQVKGEEGVLSIPREKTGDGPLRLRPIAIFGDTRVQGASSVVN